MAKIAGNGQSDDGFINQFKKDDQLRLPPGGAAELIAQPPTPIEAGIKSMLTGGGFIPGYTKSNGAATPSVAPQIQGQAVKPLASHTVAPSSLTGANQPTTDAALPAPPKVPTPAIAGNQTTFDNNSLASVGTAADVMKSRGGIIAGGSAYDPADKRIAAAPKENIDAYGRGYNDQVANAMQVNANNGLAPTNSQIKTTGITTDQQMNLLAGNNKDSRFDKQIAALAQQAANEKSIAVENAKAMAGIAGHQIAAQGQVEAAKTNAAGRVAAAKAGAENKNEVGPKDLMHYMTTLIQQGHTPDDAKHIVAVQSAGDRAHGFETTRLAPDGKTIQTGQYMGVAPKDSKQLSQLKARFDTLNALEAAATGNKYKGSNTDYWKQKNQILDEIGKFGYKFIAPPIKPATAQAPMAG